MSNLSWVQSSSETNPCCCGCSEEETLRFTFYSVNACGTCAQERIVNSFNMTVVDVFIVSPGLWQNYVVEGVTATTCGDPEADPPIDPAGASGDVAVQVTCVDNFYDIIAEMFPFTGQTVFYCVGRSEGGMSGPFNNQLTCDADLTSSGYGELTVP